MISRGGTDDSLIRINTNPLCDTLAYRNARSGGESRRMTQKHYYLWFSYLGADNTSPSDEWTNMKNVTKCSHSVAVCTSRFGSRLENLSPVN